MKTTNNVSIILFIKTTNKIRIIFECRFYFHFWISIEYFSWQVFPFGFYLLKHHTVGSFKKIALPECLHFNLFEFYFCNHLTYTTTYIPHPLHSIDQSSNLQPTYTHICSNTKLLQLTAIGRGNFRQYTTHLNLAQLYNTFSPCNRFIKKRIVFQICINVEYSKYFLL